MIESLLLTAAASVPFCPWYADILLTLTEN